MLMHKTAAVAVASALVLAACGGGDDAPPPAPPVAPTAVPDSALASSTALTSYLQVQKSDDETAEALTLPPSDIATSETDEPLSL